VISRLWGISKDTEKIKMRKRKNKNKEKEEAEILSGGWQTRE
jgi:hypothetical protein